MGYRSRLVALLALLSLPGADRCWAQQFRHDFSKAVTQPTPDVKPGVGSITPFVEPLLPAPIISIPKDPKPGTEPKPWQVSGDPNHPQLRARVTKIDGDEDNHLNFGIIGIQWSRMVYPTVTRVFLDTPAAKADILPGDQIIAIDSHSLASISIPEASSLMLGPPDTAVILSIQRQGQLRAAVVVRMDVDAIKDPTVRAAYGRSISKVADSEALDGFRF